MRKHQQKQTLTLIKTIEQAQSAGLYVDCQEGAVSIGRFIESIEGESTQTVALLEEYCELLFKASKGEIREKQLRKHLIKIENSVIDELKPNRIEMVFFPYKVSMWDSLESIYLAAKADPNCDAYVVPIPSYELNPNGTLGRMHYDGNQYPKDIPVVDWQTYDIEARHPDVIFIHYAYDDNVNNATIHPSFYSKRLREHCEKLIYSPYFVTVGDTVDEYCGYLPGVLYAHHVIVQSEAVRQSYIEHYKRFDKEFGWKGQFGKAEEKFIALGSPKFDKVINTKREDCELSDEWTRLIYKPDGSRKKVILYNTHMFTWINGGVAYFKKLHSVFELFRSRDDVVLWWRPHPNTELNFRTKRPEWQDAFRKIVHEYKSGGWGIYDDTPDFHRAIAWSDAYYGDMSSVIALYQTTGKPIVIQNMFTHVISEKKVFCGDNISINENGDLWLTSIYSTSVLKILSDNLDVDRVYTFPQLKHNTRSGICGIFFSEKYMFLFPNRRGDIVAQDKSSGEIIYFKIDTQYMYAFKQGDFCCGKIQAVEYGNKVFCFGQLLKAVLEIDIETQTIRYHEKLYKELHMRGLIKTSGSPTEYYFKSAYFSGHECVFLPCFQDNCVVVFNLETAEHSIYNITFETPDLHGFSDMAQGDEQSCFLISASGRIIHWDMKTGAAKVCGEDIPKSPERKIIALVDGGSYLLAFFRNGKALSIDKTTGNISDEKTFFIDDSSPYIDVLDVKKCDDYIYAVEYCQCQLYRYDLSTGVLEKQKLLVSEEQYDEIMDGELTLDNEIEKISILYHIPEDACIGGLPNYLSIAMQRDMYGLQEAFLKEDTCNVDGSSGEKIYKYINKQLL